ncbi:hypothetical protein RJ640_004543 [Escallonia rubra]|uniref:Uncharacterized protein n=1 Tax=Escallonia rubra TaxID=112253 RepID=A0AA88UKB7_9ASTE|nr:hypothetical protein RJ640_004543 [Escallonia rubra]
MTKNRNKKKRDGSSAMDTASDQTVINVPQAMDMSESAAPKQALSAPNRCESNGDQWIFFFSAAWAFPAHTPLLTFLDRFWLCFHDGGKVKKGVQMKRTKNVRKMKAIAKAISQNEKSVVKVSKNESKTLRTQSAKKLYD